MKTSRIRALVLIGWAVVVVDPGWAAWEKTTIDHISYPRGRVSLALDFNQFPRITYSHNNTVRYAQYNGGVWQLETIAPGYNPAMAIDASNRSHVVYGANSKLYYAVQAGSSWTSVLVDTPTHTAISAGPDTSIAVDGNGYPHLAYYDYNTSGPSSLKHARWSGSNWFITVVDTGANTGTSASIAFGVDGKPNIAYYGGGYVKYATFDGLSWNKNNIDNNPGPNASISLKIDSNNIPHIAYCSDNEDKVKYATIKQGAWSIIDVDEANYTGGNSSLSLDSSNNPHISYCKDGRYYARWTGYSWARGFIDTTWSTGGDYTAIAVDNNGNPVVASYVVINGDYQLRYYKMIGNPSLETSNVTPVSGSPHQLFTYEARYISSTNEAPAAGFPQLIVTKGPTVVVKSGMKYQSGNYNTGAVYSTSTYMPTVGNDYNWTVIACSSSGAMSVNTLSGTGPLVSSIGPHITPGYANSALSIENGFSTTFFTYKIKYRDIENDMPKPGYPKLHILQNGIDIAGSPFTMSEAGAQSSQFSEWRVFEFSKMLSAGNHSYYVEVYDIYDSPGTGELCYPVAGPQVTSVDSPVQGEIKVLGSSEWKGIIRPGTGKTLISFQGSQKGAFKCRILNTDGEILFEEVKFDVSNGLFEWIPRDISSGIYIVQVEGPGINTTKKLAILR